MGPAVPSSRGTGGCWQYEHIQHTRDKGVNRGKLERPRGLWIWTKHCVLPVNIISVQNAFNRCLLNMSVLFLLNPTLVQAGHSWDSFTSLFKMKVNQGLALFLWEVSLGHKHQEVFFKQVIYVRGSRSAINAEHKAWNAEIPALKHFPSVTELFSCPWERFCSYPARPSRSCRSPGWPGRSAGNRSKGEGAGGFGEGLSVRHAGYSPRKTEQIEAWGFRL